MSKTGMEVEESSFVNDSEDSNEEEKIKTENKQIKQQSKGSSNDNGESTTIKLSPIPRGFTESHIYELITSKSSKIPLSIRIIKPTSKSFENKYGKYDIDACAANIIFKTNNDALFVAKKLNSTLIPNLETENISFDCVLKTLHKKYDNISSNWIKFSNLSNDITEQQILTHIQNKTNISNKPKTILLYHHPLATENDKYTGYAVVELQNNSDANKCVKNLNLTKFGKNGGKIWCRLLPKKPFERNEELSGKTKSIALCNIHYTLKQDDIMELCSKYGTVNECNIWIDKMGYPTGFAFLIMNDFDDATKLFEGLHDEKIKNLNIITAYSNRSIENKKGKGKRKGKRKGKGKLRGIGGISTVVGGSPKKTKAFSKIAGKGTHGTHGTRGKGRGPKLA